MWVVISEERMTEDMVRYTAYGVRNSSYCIADLCADREEIIRFAKALNRYNVSVVNAMDIAEDYVAAGGFPFQIERELEVTA